MADSNHKNSEEQTFRSNSREVITLRPNTLHSPSAKPLSINEQRILFYSIWKIQHNQNSVSFTKSELKEAFGVDFGSYKEIKNYMTSLRSYGIDIDDEKTGRILFVNSFTALMYNNGVFEFRFSPEFLPVIGAQKRFLQLGMHSIEKFKSRYSVYFYQWLKDNMWGPRRIVANLGLQEFKEIFKLEPDAYKGQNSNFRKRVWQTAVDEINLYTDYEIRVEVKGRGEATRYTVNRLQNEDLSKKRDVSLQENKQIFECKLGLATISPACHNCMRINKCPLNISPEAWMYVPRDEADTINGLRIFQKYTFWDNPYYDLETRIKNGVVSDDEQNYYDYVKKKEKELSEFAVDYPRTIKEALDDDRKIFLELYFGLDEDESD